MNKMMVWVKQHILVTILIAFAVVALIIASVIVLSPHNNAVLVVSVAPVDAEVLIGQEAYENGTFRNMAPGHYTVVISKDGFEGKTVELELKNDEVVYLNEYLAQSDSDFDYYETDRASMMVLREYSGSHEEDVELKTFLEDYDKKKTIEELLPLEYEDEETDGFYELDFLEGSSMCKKSYCLTISMSDDIYKDLALTTLKVHGYDPEDYEIIDVSDSCD